MPHDDLPSAIIYTDGGCNPNPGPGGWAAILRLPDADR
ncbi:MAG: ribonuclease HI, partial [Anaerolineaceae bacterium]|nr:ribonuclease HI [Anaerolineaceae bacterium]